MNLPVRLCEYKTSFYCSNKKVVRLLQINKMTKSMFET